jgi:YD repeat-containing protein
MADARSLLHFPSHSEERRRIFYALAEGTATPAGLTQSLPVSRRTVQRTLSAFADRGLVERETGEYSLTTTGQLVYDAPRRPWTGVVLAGRRSHRYQYQRQGRYVEETSRQQPLTGGRDDVQPSIMPVASPNDDPPTASTRREIVGVLAAAGVVSIGGCLSTIQSEVFKNNPHPNGTIIVTNEDDDAHDLALVAVATDTDETVLDRSLSMSGDERRVFEELLGGDRWYEVTVTTEADAERTFQINPTAGGGRTATVTITEGGSLRWIVEAT